MIPGLVSTKAFWAPQVAALADIANISVADHTRQANMWVSPAIRAKRRRWVNALAHVPGEVSVDAGVDEVPVSGNVAASSAAI